MKKNKLIFSCLLIIIGYSAAWSQDSLVHYTGKTLVNADYLHGQLSPVPGVHSFQIFRANRQHPELASGLSWTYNHAPMMAYFHNCFYVEFLSDSVSESVPPGRTLIMRSADGEHWEAPHILFPPYKIPDGTVKDDHPGIANNLYAVMHQRMGFYTSKQGRLLSLGFYGICLDAHDDPNDGNGIGRVVREIFPDGSMGPIYFVRYNHHWSEKNTAYPFYTHSKDKGFVKACQELMANPLFMMQWVEEADRNDPLIPLKKQYKAFNFYHLPDGRVVGLWKYALTAISTDEGKSWPENAQRAPHFVNANAKFWGQRLADGSYATVYNPSEFRWPLALSQSKDGLNYYNLLLINGDVSPMRYGGNYKSYGPQYVRGIIEGNGKPSDQNLWVTYSMNKEDIWVSCIPVPLRDHEDRKVNDDFSLNFKKAYASWNVYSPMWASVSEGKDREGKSCLQLEDADPFEYAVAERVFPKAVKTEMEFALTPLQNTFGNLYVEWADEKNISAIQLIFDSTGSLICKVGARYKKLLSYEAGKTYVFKVSIDADSRFYEIFVDGKKLMRGLQYVPTPDFNEIIFRSGAERRYPTIDAPAEQHDDLKENGLPEKKAVYLIHYLKTF